jgi:hydroxymethylpyrimidine kinase/phosphomethylpyrimidine kinase
MKGGHLTKDKAVDILFDGKEMIHFESELIQGVNNHGSGCTLASAIAAAVARGETIPEAVNTAKTYITRALQGSLQLSPGLRVIDHFPQFFPVLIAREKK